MKTPLEGGTSVKTIRSGPLLHSGVSQNKHGTQAERCNPRSKGQGAHLSLGPLCMSLEIDAKIAKAPSLTALRPLSSTPQAGQVVPKSLEKLLFKWTGL